MYGNAERLNDLKVHDSPRIFHFPTHRLVEQSPLFRTLFELPIAEDADANVEGSCKEKPIVLPYCTEDELECLLDILYPMPMCVSLLHLNARRSEACLLTC